MVRALPPAPPAPAVRDDERLARLRELARLIQDRAAAAGPGERAALALLLRELALAAGADPDAARLRAGATTPAARPHPYRAVVRELGELRAAAAPAARRHLVRAQMRAFTAWRAASAATTTTPARRRWL